MTPAACATLSPRPRTTPWYRCTGPRFAPEGAHQCLGERGLGSAAGRIRQTGRHRRRPLRRRRYLFALRAGDWVYVVSGSGTGLPSRSRTGTMVSRSNQPDPVCGRRLGAAALCDAGRRAIPSAATANLGQ